METKGEAGWLPEKNDSPPPPSRVVILKFSNQLRVGEVCLALIIELGNTQTPVTWPSFEVIEFYLDFLIEFGPGTPQTVKIGRSVKII